MLARNETHAALPMKDQRGHQSQRKTHTRRRSRHGVRTRGSFTHLAASVDRWDHVGRMRSAIPLLSALPPILHASLEEKTCGLCIRSISGCCYARGRDLLR